MGRRITNGLTGNVGSSISSLSVVGNSLITVIPNQNIVLDPDGTGKVSTDAVLHITSTEASSNVNSGALQVDGGVGVNGAIYGGGNLSVTGFSTNSGSYLTFPTWTSGTRPSGASGRIGFNSDIGGIEVHNGTSYVPVGQFRPIDVTGNRTSGAFETNFVNTSSTAITVTLPSSPNKGDEIRFFDVAKTFDSRALTVARNGQPIMGDAANLTVTTEGAGFGLVYYNSTYGWRIYTI